MTGPAPESPAVTGKEASADDALSPVTWEPAWSDEDAARVAAESAYRLIVDWLHGLTNPKTRNAYAVDIGLRNTERAGLPGGVRVPKPLPPDAWVPFAIMRGIDPTGELTVKQAEAYAHFLDHCHPKAKKTRQRRWAAVCSFYAFLQREKRVYLTPKDLLDRQARRNVGLIGQAPKKSRALTPEQIFAVRVAARLDHTPYRLRNEAMIAVLASTGCRVEELVNLDVADFQRQYPGGPALVLLDGKGDKERWQVIPAADADLVEAYLAVRVAPDGGTELSLAGQVGNRSVEQPLFTARGGKRLHEDALAQLLRRLVRIPRLDDERAIVRGAALELKPILDTIRPHQFRHAYIETAVKKGVDINRVRQDVGHVSLVTTQDYLEVGDVLERSAAQVVSAVYHARDAELATLLAA
ncbi:tyrosine-type recombinase/integrase [Saccharothrix sp. HUAS TT1]|uniref:tyrosine-type recombinase/integrase n=1 Tax=unclassified Saccharothrix TaxID=2593673 RepID=UPI00345B4D2E